MYKFVASLHTHSLIRNQMNVELFCQIHRALSPFLVAEVIYTILHYAQPSTIDVYRIVADGLNGAVGGVFLNKNDANDYAESFGGIFPQFWCATDNRRIERVPLQLTVPTLAQQGLKCFQVHWDESNERFYSVWHHPIFEPVDDKLNSFLGFVNGQTYHRIWARNKTDAESLAGLMMARWKEERKLVTD